VARSLARSAWLARIKSRTVIDAANLIGAALPDGFGSSSEYIKARTRGPGGQASVGESIVPGLRALD